MITAGDDLTAIARFLAPGQTTYCAADVLAHLLGVDRLRLPVLARSREVLAPA